MCTHDIHVHVCTEWYYCYMKQQFLPVLHVSLVSVLGGLGHFMQ